jgi:hypothetical protein
LAKNVSTIPVQNIEKKRPHLARWTGGVAFSVLWRSGNLPQIEGLLRVLIRVTHTNSSEREPGLTRENQPVGTAKTITIM